MNAPPPRVPPRPSPVEPDATTYQDAPPVVASVPPPPGVPALSVRVPSLAPGGAPVELTGPPGTQLTIPGLPRPVWRWLLSHAFGVAAIVVAGVLVYFGKLPVAYLQTLIGLVVGIQIPAPTTESKPIVIATVPPSASSSPSPNAPPSAPAVVTP